MNNGLLFGTALALAALVSCGSDTGSGRAFTPAGLLTGGSECKSSYTAAVAADAPPSEDCLEYAYDNDSVLVLRHINAAFNCCPDSLTASFTFGQREITINEAEWLTQPCDCLCLYDLDFRINDVAPGTWTITVVEPYLWQGAEPLAFTVNLVASPSGTHCVARDHYPWGEP